MDSINLWLFMGMTAGATPPPWLLPPARALAVYGPWACMAVLGWIAWRRPHQRGHLVALLAMAGVTSMFSHAIADALGVQRPFALGLAPAHIPHGASAALPSTHAAVMGLAALGLAWQRELRRPACMAALVALLTGWARIYVGVHTPLDIAAGFGLSCAAMALLLGLQWVARHGVVPAFVRIQRGEDSGRWKAPVCGSAEAPFGTEGARVTGSV
ncbi:MAG: phosphatase PAP2 family protein [Xenophilus sp.]